VDDASTRDDAAEVADRVGGGRVGYYRQPDNVGATANFTTCVRRSTGEWVHLLHSDDLVQPGFYERYRDAATTCPDALMIAAQTILIDADEEPLGETTPVDADRGYVRDAAITIATTNPLRCVSVVVARRAYERVGGFHPDLFHANDWEMWARVANAGPVAWVDEPKGLYRSHPGSDTSRPAPIDGVPRRLCRCRRGDRRAFQRPGRASIRARCGPKDRRGLRVPRRSQPHLGGRLPRRGRECGAVDSHQPVGPNRPRVRPRSSVFALARRLGSSQ
jgi:hypothetical protein